MTAGDLIVLDHPGKLADETVKLLAGSVAPRAADPVRGRRADRRHESEAAGRGGRAAACRCPSSLSRRPPARSRRDLLLASVRRDGPPFSVFGDSLTPIVGRLRFAGGLGSRRLDTRRGVRRAGRLQRRLGRHRAHRRPTPASWPSSMPTWRPRTCRRTSAFVPLLAELVGQMLDRRRRPDVGACGEPLVAQLPAEAGAAAGLRNARARATPTTASADSRYGELVDEAVGAVWRWASPGPPGVYRVERDGATVFATAVTIPARREPTRRRCPPTC